jgi:hypothetical protein
VNTNESSDSVTTRTFSTTQITAATAHEDPVPHHISPLAKCRKQSYTNSREAIKCVYLARRVWIKEFL